ncbi:activator of the mannose operon (transcriptional antiterminator) [Breznakia sp. PF5-3]|uniref:BglG family transcription antiterminator n=1 Tax=unclassified Breznakia TaxID=2623764 RepID=UPI002406CC3E|nr:MULTISPECIES: PTS sugar transporter subunit IIA [unclassified Breznakia]MDL2276715.1 PTS sugar transporter subunit IIA [Breznakia sp. OttesenSCG-928-G09]MDF9824349.1 activator of the mannose operon (transcriptional antiterminator) [Breznakia sp. PM6-1]MDF9835060.1 activator of the mannose operon (transcriptional antiterminator) [Breznakia sp. PF5-3]MDF9837769.1 activator of the mannose operon (transcriptional antiterminator) [Breznakia sp. PFB2-8]MDF9859648.1 activator of the mannose operon
MIDVLTEKTIRVLLKSDQPITSKMIATEIGMSISSIKHNMDYVRKTIQTSGAVLNSVPGKGFWIEGEVFEKQKLSELINQNHDKSYSFAYRKNYILDILFKHNSNYTIQIFADDLGVGRNIILRDLEVIEKWLQYFDLKIIKVRNKGVCIEGGEFHIRQAMMYNNSVRLEDIQLKYLRPDEILDYRIDQRNYNYFKEVYPKVDIIEIQKLLQQVEKDTDFVYDDVSFVQLLEYISVSLMRVKDGNIILEKNILNNCKITNRDYTAAKKLFDIAIDDVQAYLSIEVRCMAAQFVLHGSYDVATSLIKEEYYDEIARQFVERLKNIIANKTLFINEGLISDIGLFFQKKKMQQSYQMITGNYFRRDIKKQLPSLYGIVLANILPIENKLNVKFTENDIAYFVMLIDNAMEDTIYDLKTLLITSYDYNTSKYIENKIKRSIDNINISKVVYSENINEVNPEKYDLIITTTPVPFDNVLKISRRVGTPDFALIEKRVKEIQAEKQEIIVKDYHLFSESLIIPKYNAKRKEDVIEKGCKLLMEQGFVSEGFEEKILQRENITPTSIGNGIAIPHGYRTHVIKSGVAVIKLERPINWTEDDKVDIVFVIAIDFETQGEIYSFFSQFYELIDDHERVASIRDAKSITSILKAVDDSGIVLREV